MSWDQLDALCRKLEALGHAQSILRADEATNMPAGGGEKRAEAMSMLAGLYHETATAPEIPQWLETAEGRAETDDQHASLRELRRQYLNMTCLPADFVRRQTTATMRSEQLWRTARAKGDWEGFRPALEEVVLLMREEAVMRAEVLGLSPYDALMEQFDPGNRAAEIGPVLQNLKTFLGTFLPQALEAQDRRLADRPLKAAKGPFPIERQRALGLATMAAIGFDFEHGRLDVSHHPFCGGVPTDVRMTTRYRTDAYLPALMAVLHETGHALYEQGLPKENAHWPSNHARGMSIHESQSLFVEMQIARSAEFWEWALPLVGEHLGQEAVDGWTPADILANVNFVDRTLIRVDADEVTYPLHVILRFEMEQELVSGAIRVKDIPEAWDARMRDFLGLSTIDDPANGPMQDVHWPAGLFGYFPSYTLGAMAAAQQWAAMEKALPDVRGQMRRGDFTEINGWRRDNIWSRASKFTTPQILEKATGEKLNAAHFEAHLKKRYL